MAGLAANPGAMMLECPLPMYLAWGPDLVSLFNDAYRPIFGDRLPRALGARFPEIWDDLWPDYRADGAGPPWPAAPCRIATCC